jgi:hypothetical protein
MGLATMIEKLINERGSAAIMEKRLVLIKEQAEVVDRKNQELTRENAELKKENADLKVKLAAAIKAEEFVEEFGAAFKRKPDGSFHNAIYCPIHLTPAGSPDGGFPYSCSNPNCGWVSDITPNKLGATIRKLNPNSLTRMLDL